MRRGLLAMLGAALVAAPGTIAFADPPKSPDHFTISLTPQQTANVLLGLQELPFKIAAPELSDINTQIQAQMPKPAGMPENTIPGPPGVTAAPIAPKPPASPKGK